jgi:hypothetical protein
MFTLTTYRIPNCRVAGLVAVAGVAAAIFGAPSAVADAANPVGPCTVIQRHGSAYLYCAPNVPYNGTGAPSEMGLTATNSGAPR